MFHLICAQMVVVGLRLSWW